MYNFCDKIVRLFCLCVFLFGHSSAAHSTYCLVMAQYCPLLGQFLAIARHKMMHREKDFNRSMDAIRPKHSGYRIGCFRL